MIGPVTEPSDEAASHVTQDGMTIIIAGRYDAPDLHLTGCVNWEIALDPSGGKDSAAIFVNGRDLLDAVILALADTGDDYTGPADWLAARDERVAREAVDAERHRLLSLMFDAEKAILFAGPQTWSPFNGAARRAYEHCGEIVARFSARGAYPRQATP